MNTQQVQDLIRRIAREEGVNADYMLKVAAIESEFNPEAFNPKSGAAGLFQILPMNKVRDVFNPEVNTRWAAQFTRENAQHLNRRSIPVNDETLYLAHQQGREGASIIWTALQNGKNINNLPPQIERNVNANNPRRFTSLRDWYEFWASKMRSMPNPSENPLAYGGRGNTPNNAPNRLPSGNTGRTQSGNSSGRPTNLPAGSNNGSGSQQENYGNNYGNGYGNDYGGGDYGDDNDNGYNNGYAPYPNAQQTPQEANSGGGLGGFLLFGAAMGALWMFLAGNNNQERTTHSVKIIVKEDDNVQQKQAA